MRTVRERHAAIERWRECKNREKAGKGEEREERGTRESWGGGGGGRERERERERDVGWLLNVPPTC